MVFAETHLRENEIRPAFLGYSGVHKIRKNFPRGGISLYAKNELNTSVLPCVCEEILSVQVSSPVTGMKIVFVCVYFPPVVGSRASPDDETFFETATNQILSAKKMTESVFFLGDFN